MLRRFTLSFIVAAVVGVIATPPASAQQTVNFNIGGFVPKAMASRDSEDVLFRDFYLNPGGFLVFDMKDFRGLTAGGEYLVGLGDLFDAGIGVGIYSRTSPAIDDEFTHANGSEVESDLRLRIVPVTATFRFLPLGHHDAIEPYVGAGVGILRWSYTETGDFVNASNNIVRGTFSGSDTTVGPVILAGLRVPIGSGGIGGEVRYQAGKGNLPANQGFAGTTIDLGGFNYLFNVSVRF